jgi:tetratricopeptide (TPR) repeat protein
VLEYQVQFRLQKPLIPGQFWYADDFFRTGIVLDEELEISVPKDREVKIKSVDVKPVIREEGTRRIYLWKTANLVRKQAEETSLGNMAPPAVLLSSFRSWEELGSWWSGLAQPQAAPTPEIRAKAAELTQNAKSELDKIRAIYDFVAIHNRYIAISLGIGVYQPHTAAEVFKNEYGDCKDKHTLLASMLQAAGVPAYPVLINSARRIDPDVPTVAQFDHVITAVPQGSGLVWLDTTPEVAPFGYLLFSLRDKLALITPPGKPAYLMKTPAAPPFAPFFNLDVKGKLSADGTLQAHIQVISRGSMEILLRTAFRRTPQAQWQELIQNISQAQGYGGTVSNATAMAPESTAEPFLFSYDYTRKDYPDWANHRITAPLSGLVLPQVSDDPAKAGQPVFLGEPTETHLHSEIQLPEGYIPQLLSSIGMKGDLADFAASYKFTNGIWITDYQLKVKQSEVAPSQLGTYRMFQKAIEKVPQLYTELVAGANAKGAPGSASRARAVDLVNNARLSIQQHQLSEALTYARNATEADPQFKDAWLVLATLLGVQHQNNEAVAAFHRAIGLDPDDRRPYMALAYLFTSEKRPEEAIEVWRDLLKRNPHDSDALSNLGMLLMSSHRYREAIVELEAAIDPDHSDPDMQAQLARAYLGAGETDKGVGMLKKILESDSRPEILNNVAYELADGNVDLADAQAYAERSVQAEENASAQVTIDAEGTGGIANTEALSRSWDTLGWVYFRRGDFAKAENYLHAAWMLGQDSTVADHLGQVYEKQGKKELALQMYGAAVAVNREAIEARGHLDRLAGNSLRAAGMIGGAQDRLHQIRTLSLASTGTIIGSAEVIILFSKGPKVEQVRLLSGPSSLKSAEKAIAAAKFDVPFPDDGPTRLVHAGNLTCGKYTGCTFVLMPAHAGH